MRDQYLPLIPGGTVLTANAAGSPLDLMAGTNAAKYSIAGVDQLGNMAGYNPNDIVIDVSGAGGTGGPSAVFTLMQSDDNAAFVPLGSATVTANGGARIPFNPTKRYVRLDAALSGTNPTFTVDAYVGTREF